MPISREYISVKFSEPHLRERNRALSVLLEMSNFLSSSLNLDNVLQGALAKVLEWFNLTAGRIYLLDEAGVVLYLAAFQGLEAGGLERLRVTEGFSGKAVRTRSFIAQDVTELDDLERSELLASKGIKVVVCVPLIAMDKVLGVMNLAADKLVEFDTGEIDLLISLGNQIAVAANNIKLYEDLMRKVRELNVQKEAIKFFAYSISHDLKSPAVGIYGLTRRLHQLYCEILDERGRKHCDQILKAAEQIVRLVDRINAYIMAKESPMHFEPVSIKELTETIRTEFSESMLKRNVRWTEPYELPSIVADKLSIMRMLRNLVDNALKYGGSSLTEIWIEYRDVDDYHVLVVGDDGVSLREEDSEELFQLFHRHKTAEGVEGTGLGLATVKELAERHNGKVWLEQTPGKGTIFCISILKGLKPRSRG